MEYVVMARSFTATAGVAMALLLAACETTPSGSVRTGGPIAVQPLDAAGGTLTTGKVPAGGPVRLTRTADGIPERQPLPPAARSEGPPPAVAQEVVPVLPETRLEISFDVRALDVRRTQAERLGQIAPRSVAEGEVLERGVIAVPLDRQGRGVGTWSNREPYAYLGRLDAGLGRYQPMVEMVGLQIAAAVQPSPTPGRRWVRVVATLNDISTISRDPLSGVVEPTVRTERWVADLDLQDAQTARYAFFVQPDYRTEIRLDTATVRISGR